MPGYLFIEKRPKKLLVPRRIQLNTTIKIAGIEPLETENVLDVPRRGSFPLSRNFAWVTNTLRIRLFQQL
jgi:hypothetical protein